MAEPTSSPTLQDVVGLFLEAEEKDVKELLCTADAARYFLATTNRRLERGEHRFEHMTKQERESRDVYDTLQDLIAQGHANPRSTVIVSIDIEATWLSADLESEVPELQSITELGLSVHLVGDAFENVYSRRYVVEGHRSTTRRMSNKFGKGRTELVRHQTLLGHRLSATVCELQNRFETLVLVGWDIQNDLRWLKDRVGWDVPAGIVVVDVQRAIMHKHVRDQRPNLFEVLMGDEAFGVSERTGEVPREEQMHNAGYDAYWTLVLAFCAGEHGIVSAKGSPEVKLDGTPPPSGTFALRLEVVSHEPRIPTQQTPAGRRVVHKCILHGRLSHGKVSRARLSHGLEILPPAGFTHEAVGAGHKRKAVFDNDEDGTPNKRIRLANAWVECNNWIAC